MREGIKTAAIVALRCILHILWLFPIRREIVFSSYEGKRVGCNPESICDELITQHPELRKNIVWIYRRDADRLHLYDKGLKTVPYGGIPYFFHILTAKVLVFNDLQKSSFIPFRKDQFMLQTWHGCGLYKKVGHDIPGASRSYHKHLDYIASHISLFSSGCRSFTETVIRGAFGYNGEVLEIGLPRNDVLLSKEKRKYWYEQVRDELNLPLDQKLILVAPTFRNGGFSNLQFVEDPLVTEALTNRFGNFIYLLRTHYMDDPAKSLPANCIDVTSWPDMQELLCAADVLISDYSSCIWDFSLTEKPCLLYAPDLSDYQNERDFYLNIHEWPFPLSTNPDEFINTINEFNPKSYQFAVKDHLKALGSTETGKASQLLANRIFDEFSH